MVSKKKDKCIRTGKHRVMYSGRSYTDGKWPEMYNIKLFLHISLPI